MIPRSRALVTDLANAPAVFRGMKELQPITPGPIHQGSRLLAIRGEFDEEFIVADYDPPTSYVLEGGVSRLATSIGLPPRAREFREPDRTGVRLAAPRLWRLAEPLFRLRMGKEYRETFAQILDRLDTLAAEETPNTDPR